MSMEHIPAASTRTAKKLVQLVERQSRPPACEILGYLISFRMNVMRTLPDMLVDAKCWEGFDSFLGKTTSERQPTDQELLLMLDA